MAVVDLEELREIMDDDMELIRDCFDDFLADWPQMFADIREAASHKNLKEINETAHRLKGTLKYLAAEPAARAALAIEQAGSQNDLDGLDQKVADLERECLNLVAYINDFQP